MRFLLGVLVGYTLRGKQKLLIRVLVTLALVVKSPFDRVDQIRVPGKVMTPCLTAFLCLLPLPFPADSGPARLPAATACVPVLTPL